MEKHKQEGTGGGGDSSSRPLFLVSEGKERRSFILAQTPLYDDCCLLYYCSHMKTLEAEEAARGTGIAVPTRSPQAAWGTYEIRYLMRLHKSPRILMRRLATRTNNEDERELLLQRAS